MRKTSILLFIILNLLFWPGRICKAQGQINVPPNDLGVQLFQSDKLASVGKLTAGIAHEINTPLGAIKSNADVTNRCVAKLETSLESGKNNGVTPADEYKKYVQLLKENSRVSSSASDRIAQILTSLKNITRLDGAEYQKVNLHDGIESTLTLIDHAIHDQIKIVKEYGDIPKVGCYPGDLNQVFMNLLTNAAQSIRGKGTITIKTFIKNDRVHVQFTDTGIGIEPERIQDLFEPGFATKKARVKAGLGLFTSHNLIQKHRGQINVESDVGKGSVFTVVLPLDQQDPVDRASG